MCDGFFKGYIKLIKGYKVVFSEKRKGMFYIFCIMGCVNDYMFMSMFKFVFLKRI